MRREVLQQELFQISEKIKQMEYKLHKQKDEPSKVLISKKKENLEASRQQIKTILRLVYA